MFKDFILPKENAVYIHNLCLCDICRLHSTINCSSRSFLSLSILLPLANSYAAVHNTCNKYMTCQRQIYGIMWKFKYSVLARRPITVTKNIEVTSPPNICYPNSDVNNPVINMGNNHNNTNHVILFTLII